MPQGRTALYPVAAAGGTWRKRQASGEALKLFISYSRADMAATDVLVAELEQLGFKALIDRRDLPYGEQWQVELGDFIKASDAVVWLVSPDSVRSKWCNWELGEVGRLSKRLIPIRIRDTSGEMLPEALGKIHLLPATGVFDFATHLMPLVETLNTDHAWLKDSTRLADRARQWIGKGRDRALLLRGGALAEAESWSRRHPNAAPPPAGEILELILASRHGQTRRQRVAVALSVGAAVLGIGLAATAFVFQQQAEANAAEAARQAAEAERQATIARANEQRALEQEQIAKDERDNVLIGRSRFLADQAAQRLAAGDATTATLAALEALPDPDQWEGELATREAERASSRRSTAIAKC